METEEKNSTPAPAPASKLAITLSVLSATVGIVSAIIHGRQAYAGIKSHLDNK